MTRKPHTRKPKAAPKSEVLDNVGATELDHPGGHGLAKLSKKGASALRTPQALQVPSHTDKVTLENYDDQDFGYLRVIVTASQLRIEYQPASDGDGAKTPDDFVTVDLATRKLVHFAG